ncbi:MAG: hypothetical protein ACTSU5_20550 [Promethearchaeota archaeon]
MSGKQEGQSVKIRYPCPVCGTTHDLDLPADLPESQVKFPFPYAYLHGETRDILTILYLDKQLKVRGTEIKQLGDGTDDIFSKDQALDITTKLMEEVEMLRSQLAELTEKYEALREKCGEA